MVERCLESMGPLPVKDKTRQELIDHAMEHGDIGGTPTLTRIQLRRQQRCYPL